MCLEFTEKKNSNRTTPKTFMSITAVKIVEEEHLILIVKREV